MSEPSMAFVQDALPVMGGAERVLEAALEIFPKTPIFTLVYHPEAFTGSIIREMPIHTSFLNKIPFFRRHHRLLLPLMPFAIEQLDVTDFDIIISFNYAVAHGVLARPDQLHLSYTHTPLRQAWQSYHPYIHSNRFRPLGWIVRMILHRFRQWDFIASRRVDQFIAPSHWIAQCIWRAYRRESLVIYPPVAVDEIIACDNREEYFITVSRMEPRKRVDLIVEAFNRLKLPLVVVGEGQDYRMISQMAGPTIKLLGYQPDPIIRDWLSKARAFVYAAEEDFGIAPVEAQAAGCPVIAYGKGGVRETVVEGQTGLFYPRQDVESLVTALLRFEREREGFDLRAIRKNSERFNKQRFQRELAGLVENKWMEFSSSRIPLGFP